MKTRLATNPEALHVLHSYYTARNTPTPTTPTTPTLTSSNNSVAAAVKPLTTTVPNQSGAAISGSGLEGGTKDQLTSQLGAIHKQYDDKIKAHTDYSNRVNDTY